jgi:RecB family exonuclease
MTQAAVQALIAQALREKAAQDSAGMQVLAAEMVQAEAAKGLFDKGTQGDRLQRRNAELEAELQEARHALIMALQDRRELRRFVDEWSRDNAGRVDGLVGRVDKLLPGEEE